MKKEDETKDKNETKALSIKDDPLMTSFINSSKSGGLYIPPYRMEKLIEAIREKTLKIGKKLKIILEIS